MSAISGMRVPVVGGVGGGVGTTTVAVGLRGHDGGRAAGRRPDILVCRDTLDSVCRAAEVLDGAGPEPPPVLAVTLAGRALRGALRARLELLEPDAAGLVLLPHVRRWSTLADPLAEAAGLLVDPDARLPRPLRAYAAALRELVAVVAASGRLGGDASRRFGPPRPPTPPPVAPAGRRLLGTAPVAVDRPQYPGPPRSRPAHPDPGPPQRRRGVRIVAPAGLPPPGAAVGAGRIEQVG